MPTSTRPAQPGHQLTRSRRLGFSLTIALVFIACQEVLFRSLFALPEVEGFNRIRYQMKSELHPDAAKSLKQGLAYESLRFDSDLDGFSEAHQLNAYGFRGPDFAVDPPASRRRILLIGDSIVEGQGAPEPATIGAALQRHLARDGIQAEVLNLGVVAATVDRLTRLVRDSVPLLRPTDVVFVLYANDLPAPAISRDLLEDGPTYPRRRTAWWKPRALELVGRVLMAEPIRRRWPRRVIPFFTAVPSETNPWTRRLLRPPDLDPELHETMRAGRINPWLHDQALALPGMLNHDFSRSGRPTGQLRRVSEICRAAGANLLVAYVPFYAVTSPRYAPPLTRFGMPPKVAEALSSDPTYRRQNAMLEDLCKALELPFCDSTEPLRRAEAAGIPQFWDYDSHPRPAGYATIARAIHEAWSKAYGGRAAGSAGAQVSPG